MEGYTKKAKRGRSSKTSRRDYAKNVNGQLMVWFINIAKKPSLVFLFDKECMLIINIFIFACFSYKW